MKESIRVQITEEDIAAWKNQEIGDPLLAALKRATQTPWRLAELNCAVESAAPYRILILRSDMLTLCRAHKTAHDPQPFEFETELISPFFE